MDSANNRITECVSDIVTSLSLDEDQAITLESHLHLHFAQALSEYDQYVDSLFGDIEYDPED